jgi:hypothetical protein
MSQEITFGYLGNSFIYYNDLPRTLHAMHPEIISSSTLVLRGGCSLTTLLTKGAKHPLKTNIQHQTVADMFHPQAIFTYVVMNDYSQGPARPPSRAETIQVLTSTYAPLLLSSDSTPVIMATWSYRAHVNDSDDLGDVHSFTNKLHEGAVQYKAALDSVLPPDKEAIIAPVGRAFAVIHDENPELWRALFDDDEYHPSMKGTDLIACVLSAALHLPLPSFLTLTPPAGRDEYFYEVASRVVSSCEAELAHDIL